MYSALRQRLINHYADMALNPATLEQARHRALQLEKCDSGLWTGIAKQIKEKIDEKKKQIQTETSEP
jgi:hypothetical protein